MGTDKNNPFTGAGYFFQGVGLISRKGLRRFVAIPLLINVALFSAVIYLGAERFAGLLDQLKDWLPDWLSWLTWLIWPVFVLAILLVVFFTFGILGNLIAAPFNGLLAEAVERRLTGQPLEGGGGLSALAKDVVKSLYSELRKLLYFALWAIPFLILLLVPVAGPFLWLAFAAWMLAVEYADFPMGNHGLIFPDQRRILAERRLLSLGFGGITSAALMVPVVNFLVIPAAVAGATAMWVDQLSKTRTAQARLPAPGG